MTTVGRDAWELADAVRAGDLSARDLLEDHLARIEACNPTLNAVWFLDVDGARSRAKAIDDRVAAGDDPGPFAGVPMGIKELASVEGWPDTHASLAYRDQIAPADGTEVARLRAAGAVPVGLTTASEFGAVSFTNTPLHGVTRNPWDTSRTPGGSSGGSAASVAAAMFPACSGSDGGGSIRIPSSYCGLPGMKSTYGFSGSGPGPHSFSMTSVPGPIVRSVRDAARYLDVIAGPTLTDPTSHPRPPVSFEAALTSGEAIDALRGARVAWSSTLGYASTDTEVEKVTHDAAQALIAAAGMELVDLDPVFPKPGTSWSVLSTLDSMASDYEAIRDHIDDVTEVIAAGFASFEHLRPDVVLKAIRGHRAAVAAPAAGFASFEHLRPDVVLKAIRGHRAAVAAAAAVFESVDLLLTPTTPTPAFEAEGRLYGTINGKDVTLMGLSAAFTAPFNLSGQPACSIPVGFVDGMPVALQVVGRRFDDLACLAAAAVFETERPWPKLAPFGAEGSPPPVP